MTFAMRGLHPACVIITDIFSGSSLSFIFIFIEILFVCEIKNRCSLNLILLIPEAIV